MTEFEFNGMRSAESLIGKYFEKFSSFSQHLRKFSLLIKIESFLSIFFLMIRENSHSCRKEIAILDFWIPFIFSEHVEHKRYLFCVQRGKKVIRFPVASSGWHRHWKVTLLYSRTIREKKLVKERKSLGSNDHKVSSLLIFSYL